MHVTYGVVWRQDSQPFRTGKLELLPLVMRLEGRNGGYEIPYADLVDVRVGRSPEDRLGGQRSLVVERRSGERVTIATVAQTPVLSEIVEHLTALQADSRRDEFALDCLASPAAGDSGGY